jgi:hypothetical protein
MMKRLTGEGCKPKPTPEQRGLTEGVQALLLERAKELSRTITERVRRLLEPDRDGASENVQRS